MSKRKRILVTGGAGFLGSYLCEELLQEKNYVICLDNFITGSHQNIAHLQEDSNFEILNHDICNSISLEVDEIYNLASPASPVHYQADPIFTLKTNVWGAFNVLEMAKKNRAKIFQASTSEVYGDPHVHPQRENYWGHVNAIGIRSCYDEGKRCSETLFFDFWRRNDIEIKLGRIFNTYGPRMDPQDGRVVSNFIVQALLGKPLTIYGDGRQTRSFCFVEDLIEAILLFMKTSKEVIGPLNLGNPQEFTIIELAEKILEISGSSSKIAFQALPEDDPKQRKPDIGAANHLLGWHPKTSLYEGLKRTIDYFDRILSKKERAFNPAHIFL